MRDKLLENMPACGKRRGLAVCCLHGFRMGWGFGMGTYRARCRWSAARPHFSLGFGSKERNMGHSHLSRASIAAAAEVSNRQAASSEASSVSVPVTQPDRPLEDVLLAIRADAVRDAADYLKATEVPFGGE